jgi:excinuclease ABC subunit A
MTEIYEYLKLLYARIGKTISPVSGEEVRKDDVADVKEFILKTKNEDKVFILAKFKQHRNRNNKDELLTLQQKGFTRVLLTGIGKETNEIKTIEELLELADKEIKKVAIEYVLIDRLVVREFDEDDWHRIADSISTAFSEGEGDMFVQVNGKTIHPFNNRFERDGMLFDEPSPNLFSFNNPVGACPVCEGFSQVLGIDEELVIPNKGISVFEGAVAPWKGEKMDWWRQQFVKGAKKLDFPIHKPIASLSAKHLKQLWEGGAGVYGINDFFKDVESNLYKVQFRVLLSRYRGRTTCPECHGARLRKEALYVKVNGLHIGELSSMPVEKLTAWVKSLESALTEHDKAVAKRILQELNTRLKTLLNVGLGYLTLGRLANSLSGGESQRIQLTRNLGSNLTNSLYILDEPSIGLHARDTANLIRVLKELRDLGNTVLVVEHDAMMMQEADHIIDMGPLASHLGGEVIATGTQQEIMKNEASLTGKYLSGKLSIPVPAKVRKWNSSIKIKGALQNNLKNIDAEFPLGVLCVVSGVSGSGKTTLIKQILVPAIKRQLGDFSDKPGVFETISGDVSALSQIELVDQNPIGKSSRSNPVTYIKAYDEIRDLFAKQPLSKMRAFQPKHFSFNVDGGRCDTCKGEGEQIVEMQFLADVHLQCESCGGKRFKEEVLEVTYKEKSIHDVLQMSVDEAIDFFSGEKGISKALQPLSDVGLGYIKLGQSSDTLSGGEAQRVKLASFLGRGKPAHKILFVFDEPTTGLHFHDIQKLLSSLQALIEQGHSILVIEHNTDVIRAADWVIELGPEAGDAGGKIIFTGTPAELKKSKLSYTAQFI